MPNWNFAQPQWQGTEDLSAKTILLHAEQGLGDTLQFVRYAPLVAARGGRVIVACQAPLKRLLTRLEGVAQVISVGEPWPDFDLHCPLSSLPFAFDTNLATIPAKIPYLHADPADMIRWQARMGDTTALKVGLVWAGASREHNARLNSVDRIRSMKLAGFSPLAKVGGVRYFSLQKGKPASQGRGPPHPMALLDYTDELHDFADTAALVAQLDLVITVDTAVAHLAGGMGKPVWILSRFHGCWRWLLDRDDSPWYPTARLFRQPELGDWDSVMERVRDELLLLTQARVP